MKRIIALVLACLMLSVMFVSCGNTPAETVATDPAVTDPAATDPAATDAVAPLTDFVIGITYYEPMNYFDASGKLVGFDTEFAEAVCAKLGYNPVFQEIDWDMKESELKGKTIDCIWNGLTVTEERKANMAFSESYIYNKQVVVAKADAVAAIKSNADLAAFKSVAAESGSAGQDAVEADEALSKLSFVGSEAQSNVFLEVKAGTIDLGVVDLTMARSMCGKGDYADVIMSDAVELSAEEYAIGVRLEDTELLANINKAIDELVADGTIKTIAEKYDLWDVCAFNPEAK